MPGPRHWDVDGQLKRLDGVDVIYAMRHEPNHWTGVAAVNHQRIIRIYYRNSLGSWMHAARATEAMAKYLAEEATRQDSQKWPRDPQDYALVNRSSAPQQPDGVSCGCCVLMDLEALCTSDGFDSSTGRFRRRSNYTSLDVAQWRARWQCSLRGSSARPMAPPPPTKASPRSHGRSKQST
mmetsp:Transcript_25005/g.86351  ORF Transcript_25005/g.86351 Transcript_25005/m.86351 type:complete len:180 (-) Transcript_25005:51-590(-)